MIILSIRVLPFLYRVRQPHAHAKASAGEAPFDFARDLTSNIKRQTSNIKPAFAKASELNFKPQTIIFATMDPIEIKIINRSSNPLPSYATPGSSGMDVRANIDQLQTLKPMERSLVPTGLFIEIPLGYEVQVRPRSGLAVKQGITCLNTPGTIDADYRGEIKIILINLSQEDQVIQPGDRIAQLVVQKIELANWKTVTELEVTERNAGGFGHTGKQ